MRTPLIYQMTCYDCGPTTLVNALRFLYEREELDPELLATIYARTLDDFNEAGEAGKLGTSHQAIRHVARYLNMYGSGTGFPVAAEIWSGEDALIAPGSKAFRALEEYGAGGGGRDDRGAAAASPSVAIVARIWHGENGHYTLLTGVEDGRVLAFDPYLEDAGEGLANGTVDGDRVRLVAGRPLVANRSVDPVAFHSDVKANYALKNAVNADPTDPRIGELVVIRRTDRGVSLPTA